MEAYLEGTTSSSLAWTLHGLAVKGAYQLGLHVMDSKSLSQTDREVRRRSWYWCVMNDRLVSVIPYMTKYTHDDQVSERDLRSPPFNSFVPCEIRGQRLFTIQQCVQCRYRIQPGLFRCYDVTKLSSTISAVLTNL